MDVTGLDITELFISSRRRSGRNWQATLNLIPAYAWYVGRMGSTFVNERGADYIGLPIDHPLRFGTKTTAIGTRNIPLLACSMIVARRHAGLVGLVRTSTPVR